jgi:hypothetical protein
MQRHVVDALDEVRFVFAKTRQPGTERALDGGSAHGGFGRAPA